jgi:two-component system, NarL family, sensor histidine kinase DesK
VPTFAIRAGARAADDPSVTPLWRRMLFPAVFLVFLANPAGAVWKDNHGWAVVTGEAILVAFVTCYLGALPTFRAKDHKPTYALLVVMGALVAAELPFAHADAFDMAIYVAILVVGVLGAKAAPVVVVIAGLAYFVPPMVGSWHQPVGSGNATTIIIVPLAMYGFFGVMAANRELAEARTEVARLAAEGERNRIARDLHDLLGHSLTTITVKAGLAARLADRDPTAAAREIGEVEALSRRALTDVRAAVSGYREVTLAGELATAAEVLRAAGIEPAFPPAIDGVSPAHQQLFGWVVREGVTNVVRHARATVCEITLAPRSVEIADDGHGPVPTGNGNGPRPAGGGSGLAGLRERVEAAGGTLRAGAGPAGGWLLRASVPARS